MGTPQEPIVSPAEGTGEVSGPNPAWNDVLSVLPEQFHSQVTPHFQKWDQAAQSKITDLNSQLGNFQSYSPLIEHGITIDQVNQALLLNQEINQNPKAIYDALVDAYNFGTTPVNAPVATPGESATGEGQQNTPDPYSGKFSEVEQQIQLLSQVLLQEQEAKINAQQDQKLEQEFSQALGKFPGLELNPDSENYVLSLMATRNMSAQDAMQSFVDFRNSLAPQPFAPKIVGASGGGVPSNAIDPTKLSSKETRELVAQMLAAGAQQNR